PKQGEHLSEHGVVTAVGYEADLHLYPPPRPGASLARRGSTPLIGRRSSVDASRSRAARAAMRSMVSAMRPAAFGTSPKLGKSLMSSATHPSAVSTTSTPKISRPNTCPTRLAMWFNSGVSGISPSALGLLGWRGECFRTAKLPLPVLYSLTSTPVLAT